MKVNCHTFETWTLGAGDFSAPESVYFTPSPEEFPSIPNICR